MLIERLRSSSNDSCTLYNVHTGSKTYRSVVVTTNDFICSEIAPHDKYCSMDNICVCKLKCAMLQWKCVCCSVHWTLDVKHSQQTKTVCCRVAVTNDLDWMQLDTELLPGFSMALIMAAFSSFSSFSSSSSSSPSCTDYHGSILIIPIVINPPQRISPILQSSQLSTN